MPDGHSPRSKSLYAPVLGCSYCGERGNVTDIFCRQCGTCQEEGTRREIFSLLQARAKKLRVEQLISKTIFYLVNSILIASFIFMNTLSRFFSYPSRLQTSEVLLIYVGLGVIGLGSFLFCHFRKLRCPACEQKLNRRVLTHPNWNFCYHCGTRLRALARRVIRFVGAVVTSGRDVCEFCGEQAGTGDGFCGACGANLGATALASRHGLTEEEFQSITTDNICPGCGHDLQELRVRTPLGASASPSTKTSLAVWLGALLTLVPPSVLRMESHPVQASFCPICGFDLVYPPQRKDTN